jgi:hypothetical protein
VIRPALTQEQRQNAPATLNEWNARQARRAAASEQQRAESKRRLEALRATAAPVSFDDLAGDRARMTLRQAGEVVEQAGGAVHVEDGRVIVALPPSALLTNGQPSNAAKAAARLYRAEAAVLSAASKRTGAVTVSRLPDRLLSPTGALLP